MILTDYVQKSPWTMNCTPFVPNWVYVFLTWARLRSTDHWLRSCKYESKNRKQLLCNSPQSCNVERLLDDENLAKHIWLWASNFYLGRQTKQSFWDKKNPGGRTIILGRREQCLIGVHVSFFDFIPQFSSTWSRLPSVKHFCFYKGIWTLPTPHTLLGIS